MEYDGFEQLVDDDEVFTFLKPAILTPGATERTHRYYPAYAKVFAGKARIRKGVPREE